MESLNTNNQLFLQNFENLPIKNVDKLYSFIKYIGKGAEASLSLYKQKDIPKQLVAIK